MSVNESEMETRIIMRRDSWYVRLGVLSAAGLLAFGSSDNIAGAVTTNIVMSQKNVIDQNVFYDSTKTTDEEDMNIQCRYFSRYNDRKCIDSHSFTNSG